MSELILHHYPMSPFSEKARSMLGYAQLEWQSVITREMLPRPHLAALAGGYRKIPVAQIGADIFCDSRLISSEIAALSGKQKIALDNCSDAVQKFVKEVDLDIFFASLMAGGSLRLGKKVLQSMSLADIARFARDRARMGRGAKVKMPGPRQAKPMVLAHLQRLSDMLTQDFLFGNEPCHGDFSAYHSLWFVRDLGERQFINKFPGVIAWMDRIKAFGHGSAIDISIDAALQRARTSQPRPVADDLRRDELIGKPVSIAPNDYGRDATTGTLVGSSPQRWVLARESVELGTLHVHFPRTGFVLQAV